MGDHLPEVDIGTFPISFPTITPSSASTNPTSSPSTHLSANIMIQNYNNSQEWWVAFGLSNIDLSCGGSITKVEISDGNNYDDVWVTNDPTSLQYDYYSFLRTNSSFTLPLSVRIIQSAKF
eukprot:695542_1